MSLHDGPPFARAPTGPCHRVFDLTVVASAMSLATATAPVALGGARATLRGRRLAHTGGSDKVIQKAPAVKPRRRGTVTRASAVGTNLTTWLLRQEMEHKIDGELAVVLSSVSIACKRVRARYRTAQPCHQLAPISPRKSLTTSQMNPVTEHTTLTILPSSIPPSPSPHRSPAWFKRRASPA